MIYTLENRLACVKISTHAAEVHSFINKETGLERMWQGDKMFWSGRNPILFPIVGSSFNEKYYINNKEYEMGKHGFARHSEFICKEKTNNRLVLTFCENKKTLAQYPYQFKVTVLYELIEKQLKITYRIDNHSSQTMPFSFGLHPAFNCPLIEDEQFNDYWIEFACEEDTKELTSNYILKGCRLPLSYALFQQIPTLIFEDLASPYVILTNGKNRLKVTVAGYRWLAFWTLKNAPFICIEPWHGHGDFENFEGPFELREGTMQLKKDKSFTTTCTYEIMD
jgi:galactose mutarotase-like enzyme